ncbi:MAG: zinc ribbon domain-containing protein [Clostridia bacterium]|nr:zinc ribbon domain-containing protein [Clostridia bacterium]
MEYFDKVADSVRTTAESIGKKTMDAVDASKLKVNAYEINSEIKKRYEALGRIVYDAKRGDFNCDVVIEENIREINILYDKLSEINSKIARLKNKTCCPKCSAINDNEAIYCSRCGRRLSD